MEDVIFEIKQSKEVIVTRRGVPFFKLVPLPQPKRKRAAEKTAAGTGK